MVNYIKELSHCAVAILIFIPCTVSLTLTATLGPLSPLLQLLTVVIVQLVFFISEIGNLQAITWTMLILGTEICHLGLFANEGLLSFFVFYEAALIPLIILISRFGSGNQRLRSTIVFCIFTIAGAMPMLCATLYLIQFTENLVIAGGVNMFISFHTFHSETIILWIAYAISFMVKTPLYPFISWLLAAHTEAPVEGSVLLAGIVLKLATFGISVILIANLWEGSNHLMAVAEALGLITLFVSSLAMVQQYDLKGFVALSSVAHMSLGVLGLMCLSQSGLYGGWILGFAHGIISPCLFILFGGYIYRSFSTRLIYPLRGVNVALPLASIAIFTSLLANMGFPPFANWVSEILILVSLVDKLIFTGSVATILLIFAVIYTLWCYGVTVSGIWSPNLRATTDASSRILLGVGLLVGMALLIGIKLGGWELSLEEGRYRLVS